MGMRKPHMASDSGHSSPVALILRLPKKKITTTTTTKNPSTHSAELTQFK
jgi:hypothetical protein